MKNNVSVFSFDVFDTCIARTIDSPKNLFFILGEKICPPHLSPREKAKTALAFMNARIKAEKMANAIKKSAHFNDIYKAIKIPKKIKLLPESIAKMELELEYKSSYPISKTLDEVNQARNSERKIIFISDMYLDHNFIESLLRTHGFFKDGDSLYVSSTYNATKREGILYDIVMDKEKISLDQWKHHGDDIRADIYSARTKGISAVLINHRWVLNDYSIFDKKFISPCKHILNSIPRRIQLEHQFLSNMEYKYFSLLAPLLISFTLWVLEEARKMNISRLYFVSRDGELPYKVAKIFSSQYPDVEIKYLYGSRDAWVSNTSEEEKRNLISYLNHEGLLSDKSWALVDSGWALNNQKAIQSLIYEKGSPININGFYFGLSNKRASLSEAGNSTAYSEEDFYFAKKALVVESLLFGSNSLRTIGYQSQYPFFPLFDEKEIIDINISNFNNNFHFFVEKYAHIFNLYDVDFGHFISHKAIFLSKFKAIIKNPDKEFLMTNAKHLVQKITLTDLYNLLIGHRATLQRIIWLEGCGKISGHCIYIFSRLFAFMNMININVKYILTRRNKTL